MIINLAAAARVILFTALMLSVCVSQGAYEQQAQQLQQATAQSATQQAEIARMQQENKWVVAGDMLFQEGGHQLSPKGQAALNPYAPRPQALPYAKVVVYGTIARSDLDCSEPAPQAASICPLGEPITSSCISVRRTSIPTCCRPGA